jgi:hypothetical protein
VRETARTKADRLLIEGRLIVEQVQPGHVQATCRGEGHLWHPAYVTGQWLCDCPVTTDQCSHLIALRRVVAVDLTENP